MDVDCGSARDRLGRTLGGRYELLEILGAGGTAVVYRARSADGMQYAVKVLHDHLSRSDEVCRRFVREGQLGNVLDHPGIVRVLDHGTTEEGCPYLVLEFLEGESLEERRVRMGGRLELNETLELCDQLLAVLEVAHAKNIVHRDIKPSNLFRTASGQLKVLDFGIARLVDDTSATATKTGQTVGTPAFMPPEQALSRPRDVDARTDIWSVGATIFTLLAGEHVHIAESSSEHLVKAATLHARSLARALPGVPSNVEALVARCLAFDKSQRWASAASMREELAFVIRDPGRRIGTSTSPPPERTPSDSSGATGVVGEPRPSARLAIADERVSDVDAIISLTSSPGTHDLTGSRRKWLVPVAVGSSFLLTATAALVLVFAVRTTTSSQAAVASTATQARLGSDASPPVESASVAFAPPPPPPPEASTSVRETAPATPPPVSSVVTTMPRATPPKATPPPVKKPATSTQSRKDLYRPF
ncbi:MAG TPA: serine/threonine-protein kinase [Labilithrix sp.]|nr:serine/threonine-protein kinase [Labilithrix sp.]